MSPWKKRQTHEAEFTQYPGVIRRQVIDKEWREHLHVQISVLKIFDAVDAGELRSG